MKWLKHMCNASDDEFMEWLEEEYGFEGSGRWWRILETIGQAMQKNRNSPSAEHTWSKWQSKLRGKRSQLLTFLLAIQSRGKIKIEYNENVLKITCLKMLNFRDEYSRKSGQAPKGTPDRLRRVDTDTEEEKEEESKKDSEVRTSGDESPVDFKKLIFNEGLKFLSAATGKTQASLRPLVGKWCSAYGDPPTAAAIMQAQTFQAVEPISFIEKFLKEKKYETVRTGNGYEKPNWRSEGQRLSAKYAEQAEREEAAAALGVAQPDLLTAETVRKNSG